MQLCGNAFIGQLAMELCSQAEKDNSRIINDQTVFKSLEKLGFSDLVKDVKLVGLNCYYLYLEDGRSSKKCIQCITYSLSLQRKNEHRSEECWRL